MRTIEWMGKWMGKWMGGVAIAAAGCITSPAVVPMGGAPQASAQAAGATFTVFSASWEGVPSDLADYVTPIAVELSNAGPAELRVSYVDFALVDESGFRYAALNPFVPASARRLDGAGDALAAGPSGDAVHDGTLVAGRRVVVPPPPAGHFRPVYRGGPTMHAPGFGGPLVPAPTHWRGYAPLPYYRPWYGPSFGYWANPFLVPPFYATWVWSWSPAYYPSAQPPLDVVNLGLPEGVLQSGGHVEGFLYFARAHESAHRMTLTWEMHEARTGNVAGTASVPLEVVR